MFVWPCHKEVRYVEAKLHLAYGRDLVCNKPSQGGDAAEALGRTCHPLVSLLALIATRDEVRKQ